jgi:hypothetical protein
MSETLTPSIADVVADIELVLSKSGLTVEELTLKKYSKNGGKFDGRLLRRLGGFNAIVEEAFHKDKNKDIIQSRYIQRRRQYLANLEKELADWSFLRESVYGSFKRAFEQTAPFRGHSLKKCDKPRVIKEARANVVVISDTHLGLTINPEEVMTNGYNWQIGARRLGKLAEQVAQFKLDHRDECGELHVCLGGDLGQGVIHYQSDSGTDLMAYQVAGIISYIVQMLDYWRNFYGKIVVHCTSDNHMRLTHKGPDRTTAQKFDSFATMAYLGMQMAFRECDDVTFDVPKSAITTFSVLGHKFGLTHGDTHLNTGNVGHSINVKAISTETLKLNAAVKDGHQYDCLILGHVHVPLFMSLCESNTELVVNGTGSGTDGFAESISFFRTTPYQVLWEVTGGYAVGDFRKIRLDDADAVGEYEKIIKPYNYELTY